MADSMFRSRKEQIEKDFLPKLCDDLSTGPNGRLVSREHRSLIKKELRSAAMVGAAEERYRCLKLIKEHGMFATERIIAESVLTVLGYDDD